MRGPRTKVKGSKKVPVTKSQELTCENGRRVASVPVVLQPVHAPVPLTAVPVQEQDVTVTARVPKDRAVKEDATGVPVDGFLPALGNEVLVFPQREEHVGVQTDATVFLKTLELLLALDVGLAVPKHRDMLNLGEVQFRQSNRTLVSLIRHDAPTFADALGGIEATTVDNDDLRLADDDATTVLEESGELLSCLLRVANHEVLQPSKVKIN